MLPRCRKSPWLAGSLLALTLGAPSAGAWAATQSDAMQSIDPLSRPAPLLARPLRLALSEKRLPEAKLARPLWPEKLAAAPGERLRVSVLLYPPDVADLVTAEMKAADLEDLKVAHIAALEHAFADQAFERGFQAFSGLSHTPIVFGEIAAERLLELAELPSVRAIQGDHEVRGADVEGNALIGATRARTELGAQGAGVGVAVLDTGVDLNHSEFAGRIVADANFINSGRSGQDDQGHGTGVAGIAAGATLGVAPRANLWAVKVLSAAGNGTATSTEQGLDWVYANRERFGGLKVVNMSIVYSGPFNSDCDGDFPVDAALVNPLYDAGIVITVAGGNEGRKDGITWPACLSKVMGVGAVYDADFGFVRGNCTDPDARADTIPCWSSGGVPLDVYAPSVSARTANRGGGFGDGFGGTSAAAPYAAGAAALLFGLKPQATGAEVFQALKSTGRPLTDSNGLTRNRIDVMAAYQALGGGEPPGPQPPASGCVRSAGAACLADGRFEVTVSYRGAGGNTPGKIMSFGGERGETANSALFGFDAADRYEMAVSVLDTCAGRNKKFTVLLSGQTSQGWTARIVDKVTGAVRAYNNGANKLTKTLSDPKAFACQ